MTAVSRGVSSLRAGSIGNRVAWYDLYVYAAFQHFAETLFLSCDPTAQMLSTAGMFTLGLRWQWAISREE